MDSPIPPKHKHFDPADLRQRVIAMPLRAELKDTVNYPAGYRFSIIIDLNLEYPGGRTGAMKWVVDQLNAIVPKREFTNNPENEKYGLNADKTIKNQYSQQYLFVQVERNVILELVQRDTQQAKDKEEQQAKAKEEQQAKDEPAPARRRGHHAPPPPRLQAIYHIWSDFKVKTHMNRSITTIKGDAAHAAYAAFGEGIVWAVMDSGIDYTHPHFKTYDTLELDLPLLHTDFTDPLACPVALDALAPTTPDFKDLSALTDTLGHGTHVAGIIAGKWDEKRKPIAFDSERAGGDTVYTPVDAAEISGMAAKCRLLSLKVLGADRADDTDDTGDTSSLIAAINMVQHLNGYGRHLLVHGVNMSVGYDFDPEWFACGQSPLCVEVNRLVRSGVVVVVAAGNSGYGVVRTQFTSDKALGLGLTINDPGNAELAITVGATHRDMPHVYGVSYFSSKGPTGDGRAKPDLVAPGERILSCAAGPKKLDPDADTEVKERDYVEDSGTSMAAPHVSGAIAAFLSIRREFIGHPDQVKEIFMSSATDLKREKYFQGSGLVDLMRAIQSV